MSGITLGKVAVPALGVQNVHPKDPANYNGQVLTLQLDRLSKEQLRTGRVTLRVAINDSPDWTSRTFSFRKFLHHAQREAIDRRLQVRVDSGQPRVVSRLNHPMRQITSLMNLGSATVSIPGALGLDEARGRAEFNKGFLRIYLDRMSLDALRKGSATFCLRVKTGVESQEKSVVRRVVFRDGLSQEQIDCINHILHLKPEELLRDTMSAIFPAQLARLVVNYANSVRWRSDQGSNGVQYRTLV